MAFQETIEYLFGLQKHGIKFGLANSIELMARMGDPHRQFRSVHVAGTNGKGSVTAIVDAALRAAGLEVAVLCQTDRIPARPPRETRGLRRREERLRALSGCRSFAYCTCLPHGGNRESRPRREAPQGSPRAGRGLATRPS